MKTNGPADINVLDVQATRDVVLARTWDSLAGGRVFLSNDQGKSWRQSSAAETDIDILSLVLMGNDSLVGGTWGNLYRLVSGEAQWGSVGSVGPVETAIRSMAVIDSVLFAGTTGHVYRSSDNGNTWAEAKTGIPAQATVVSLAGFGGYVFAGTDGSGVLVSGKNEGWVSAAGHPLNDGRISQVAVLGTRLFAVASAGVFVSDDRGVTWWLAASTEGLNRLLVLDDQLLAATEAQGAFLSSDRGSTWTRLGSGWPDGTRMWALSANDTMLFAGTDSGVWRAECQ